MSLRTAARLLTPATLSESAWQSRVIDLAKLAGWRVMHVYPLLRGRGGWRTPTTAKGWPDLVLVRRGRMIAAELKTEAGRLTDDQLAWLHDLADVPGVTAVTWRPRDWHEVVRVLTQPAAVQEAV